MELTRLSDKQKAAIRESTAYFNLLDGAIRSGKTVASLIAWLDFVAHAPDGKLGMVGRTERTLKHNVLDPIAEMLGAKEAKISAGSGEATIFGRKVYLFGANDERAADKIKGATLAGLYGDQVETWPETVFRMAMSRLSLPGAKAFATANPEGPRHYLKAGFIDQDHDELGLMRMHFKLDDNPFLTDAFKSQLRAANPGLWGKRFIDGLWVAAEGAIYDMLDDQRHVVGGPECEITKLPRHFDSYWLGIDYGTVNSFVCLLGAESEGRFYILDEYRWDSRAQHRQKVDSEYSADVIAFLKAHALFSVNAFTGDFDQWLYERIAVDASATSFIAQLWHDGLPGVSRSPDISVKDGIRSVSALLAADKLLFAPKMKNTQTFKELQEYVWDDKAVQRGEEKPLKVNDHGPDALRYLVGIARRVWRDWIIVDTDEEEVA